MRGRVDGGSEEGGEGGEGGERGREMRRTKSYLTSKSSSFSGVVLLCLM